MSHCPQARRILKWSVLAGLGIASAAAAEPAPPAKAESQGLLRLGSTFAGRGDYPTAEIAYWQILNRPDLTPADEKSALFALARLLRKEGSLTKAAAIDEKFIKEFPDDEKVPDALLELGRTLRDMGVYRLAISRFYSVINSTLKFPSQGFEHYELLAKTAQFEIAQTYFESGDYAEAGKYFSRVRLLDLSPEDRARASFMAAFSQQMAGELDSAIETLKAYLDQYPDDANVPEARYLLATILRKLKRPQEALTVTLDLLRNERAQSAADSKRWSYWQRRTGNQLANDFFQDGDAVHALAIYKCLSEISADPAWRLPVTYQMALCYERLRQVEESRKAYQAIVAAARPGSEAAGGELGDLAKMAAWRLQHLEWRDTADRQFDQFFTTALNPAAAPPAPKPAGPNS